MTPRLTPIENDLAIAHQTALRSIELAAIIIQQSQADLTAMRAADTAIQNGNGVKDEHKINGRDYKK